MTLASLFDGSGGFPLAGALSGIRPVWAAEVEPYPIAVTRSRFPMMQHLGSVTEVHGDKVQPVDVITFGSPSQDLSVAGKRAGIHDGQRSNLFFEAIRIIKEMRAATNAGQTPYVLFSGKPPRKYSIRRLTPLECCRLQGFPDGWGVPAHKDKLSDEELVFWQGVRDTCAAISGKPSKKYSEKALTKWYNALHTDSAEYKMWGNGIALPCAAFVLGGVAEALMEGNQK